MSGRGHTPGSGHRVARAVRCAGGRLLRGLGAARVVLGMWLTALVGSTAPARAWDDRLVETLAYHQRLKDYDDAKRHGAERVQDRVRSPFQADGIRMGDWLVFPSLGIATVYDDNIHASAGPRIPDIRFEVTPQVRLKSQLPRHAIDLSLGGRIVEYLEHSELDRNDVWLKAAGALHFDHAHTISAQVLSELVHSDVLDPTSAIFARRPAEIWHNKASIGLTRDVGRIYGTVSAGFESWDYHSVRLASGEMMSLDSRDARLFDAQIRVGYRISPGFELLGRFRGLRYVSDLDYPGNGTSTGYEAFAGLAFQTSPLLRWRLLGGLGVRDFDEPGRKSLITSLAEAEVEWLPTQLLTISATVRRSIVEANGGTEDDAASRIETAILAKMQYEMWRNLVWRAEGEYRDWAFDGTARRDRILSGRFGVNYLLTKNLHLDASIEHQVRDSTLDEFDLRRNIVRFGAKLQF